MLPKTRDSKKGEAMNGSTRHLDDILKGIAPPPPELDPDAVMESLGPCAWCFVKQVLALDVEDGAKPVETLQYVYLSIKSQFRPDGFTFLFGEAGREQWRLTVTGRNLRPIYDRINEHRLRRIRAVDRDFTADGDKQPVITGIELVEVKEG